MLETDVYAAMVCRERKVVEGEGERTLLYVKFYK